jgi:glutamate synthase domain-containing protein 3
MKMVMRIDCKGLYYRKQNKIIRDAAEEGETEFILDNANGQRYIGNGIEKNIKITVNGVPGNDLAMFMNGPTIIVNANAQDGVANTMNAGEVIVHGSAGDVIGYGMRGGKLYVRGNIGYRAGIHAKEYKKQIPIIIAGGVAGDFCGEYMAEYTLGKEVSVLPLDKKDLKVLTKHLKEYCEHFGLDLDEIMAKPFIKLQPVSSRPYGSLYAY